MCKHYRGKQVSTPGKQACENLGEEWWSGLPLDTAEIFPGARSAILRMTALGSWILEDRILGLVHKTWQPSPQSQTAEGFGLSKTTAHAESCDRTFPWKLAWRQRCVILAEGFYLPQARGKREQFYAIADKTVIAFAGLWDNFEGDNGAGNRVCLETCAILTTTGNELVDSTARPNHSGETRQPVILTTTDQVRQYCSPRQSEHHKLKHMFAPVPAKEMQVEQNV